MMYLHKDDKDEYLGWKTFAEIFSKWFSSEEFIFIILMNLHHINDFDSDQLFYIFEKIYHYETSALLWKIIYSMSINK